MNIKIETAFDTHQFDNVVSAVIFLRALFKSDIKRIVGLPRKFRHVSDWVELFDLLGEE